MFITACDKCPEPPTEYIYDTIEVKVEVPVDCNVTMPQYQADVNLTKTERENNKLYYIKKLKDTIRYCQGKFKEGK